MDKAVNGMIYAGFLHSGQILCSRTVLRPPFADRANDGGVVEVLGANEVWLDTGRE
jgi:hypothetical protein